MCMYIHLNATAKCTSCTLAHTLARDMLPPSMLQLVNAPPACTLASTQRHASPLELKLKLHVGAKIQNVQIGAI